MRIDVSHAVPPPELLGIPRQPDTAELPPGSGREEIPVAGSDVGPRRGARPSAKHPLVARELAVVLT